jgi:tyrosyl-tRNA synthetase
MNDVEKHIDEMFSRGVVKFVDPDGEFKEKLLKKINGEYEEDIIIKFGVDPTRPDIHLGHASIFRKLRQFQDLGCKVVFLIGDFSARIGDPSGKSKVRPELAQKEIEKNVQTYLDQVGTILDLDPNVFSWIRNSDWFLGVTDIIVPGGFTNWLKTRFVNPQSFIGKATVFEQTRMQKSHLKLDQIRTVTVTSLLWTLRHITHAQLIARDMFQERLKSGRELYMHEMMYPVLTGIDSFVLNELYSSCDMEVGGSDQLFNMLLARDIMRVNNVPEQSVLVFDILEGLDGVEKMSKSLDNYIAITDEPNDMYGKVMSVPDRLIGRYFKLATYSSDADVKKIEKQVAEEEMAMENKKRLAREIVAMYYGEDAAHEAEDAFTKTFSEKKIPDDVPTVSVKGVKDIPDLLLKEKIISSKSDLKRLIKEGAVTILETNTKVEDINDVLGLDEATLRIGKKRFVKLVK